MAAIQDRAWTSYDFKDLQEFEKSSLTTVI